MRAGLFSRKHQNLGNFRIYLRSGKAEKVILIDLNIRNSTVTLSCTEYSKLSRASSISSVDAGELCAVTLTDVIDEEGDRHQGSESDDEAEINLFRGSFRTDSLRKRSSDESSDDTLVQMKKV